MYPILQHLLDLLSRGFILLFLFLCVFDGGPSLSILNNATSLVVRRSCGRTGDW